MIDNCGFENQHVLGVPDDWLLTMVEVSDPYAGAMVSTVPCQQHTVILRVFANSTNLNNWCDRLFVMEIAGPLGKPEYGRCLRAFRLVLVALHVFEAARVTAAEQPLRWQHSSEQYLRAGALGVCTEPQDTGIAPGRECPSNILLIIVDK